VLLKKARVVGITTAQLWGVRVKRFNPLAKELNAWWGLQNTRISVRSE
jgi:hypothetical protein